jgi:hypothetical protein
LVKLAKEREAGLSATYYFWQCKSVKNSKLYRKSKREEGRDEKSKQSVSGIKYLIFVRGHDHNSLYK